MKVYTATKRAACDRCHKMKMRCSGPVGEGSKQCHRCRTADVHCNYSAPRRPGRPPTANKTVEPKEHAAVPQSSNSAAQPLNEIKVAQESGKEGALGKQSDGFTEAEILALLRTNNTAPNLNWSNLGFLEDDTMVHSFYQSEQIGPAFLSGAPDTDHYYETRSYINESEWRTTTLWTPIGRTEVEREPTRSGSSQSQQQAWRATIGTSASFAGLCQSTTESGMSGYRQNFSDFHLRLARAINLEDNISWKRLEQSAADILESSEIFLELANFNLPQGNKRPLAQFQGLNIPGPQTRHQPPGAPFRGDNIQSKGGEDMNYIPTSTFVPDTMAVLHLLAFSVRLSEMHSNLFAAVYRYMQQQRRNGISRRDGGIRNRAHHLNPALSSPLSVHFSIAGVVFAPQPCFQLQLLLQAVVHYLSNIQGAICRLEVLESHCDASESLQILNQGLVSEAALIRALTMQHHQRQMSGVREILTKLRQEFEINVHF